VLQTLQLSKTQMQSYLLQAEAADSFCLGFAPKRSTENRFYLDNIGLRAGAIPPASVTNTLTVATAAACLQGLKQGMRYAGVVRSLRGEETSLNSAAFTVTTSAATLILFQ
jgi:hypothetical protein